MEKLRSIALFVFAVTVVCIVVSISLIPVPEMIGMTSLIDFYELAAGMSKYIVFNFVSALWAD